MNVAAAATAHYHDLLASDGGASSRRALEENAAQLCLASSVVVRSLRPCFLDDRTYTRAFEETSAIARALRIVHRALTADATLRAAMMLSEAEEEIVQAEPRGSTEITGRFDGFFDADGTLKFVEYNSMGAGLILVDWMWQVYDAMPAMQALRRRFATRHESTSQRVVPALLRAYRSRGGVGLPSIAMVSASPADSTMRFEEWSVMAELVAAVGCPMHETRPEELEVAGGRVHVRGEPIDVVFMDDWKVLRRAVPPGHPFWGAVRDRRVWIGNSRANNVLRGDKRVLAVMTDPRATAGGLFDGELARAVERHVPWTRLVRPETTVLDGRMVDLLEAVRRDRERFVIKPATSYGGAGVVLGWEASASAWDAAIAAGLESPSVVQERVRLARETFPFAGDGDVRYEACHCDFAPYVWAETEVAGALARVSRDSIVNVSTGGSAAPVVAVAAA